MNWQLSQKHGKSEMPIVIIQNGTRKNVKSVVGTVSTIIKKSISESIANPAVIGLGKSWRRNYKYAHALSIVQRE